MFFLVVTCSALIVSHQRRPENRCGGHLKILIQAHCPLMFLAEHFALFVYWDPDGVYYGFPLLPPPLMGLHDTGRITGRATDRITWITICHFILYHLRPASFRWFQKTFVIPASAWLNVCKVCRQHRHENISVMDSILVRAICRPVIGI